MRNVYSPVKELVVLSAFANSKDAHLKFLIKEEQSIRSSLDSCGNVRYISISEATIDKIFDSFNQYWNNIGILHYAGHATSTHLHLGNIEANAKGLGELIKEHGCLPIVFLNGCSTKGQAQILLEAGVSIVIATKVAIEDQSAMVFADRFYKTLAQRHTIDKAFKDAKNFLLTHDYKSNSDFEYKRRNRGRRGADLPPLDTAWTIHVGDENVLSLTLDELPNYIDRQRMLQPYAHWLVRQHSTIPMTGLKGTTEISLDKVFVSLRGELSKSYEILQTQKFYAEELDALQESWELEGLSEIEKKQQRSRLLGRTAIMPSIDERDMRYQRIHQGGRALNLAEAFIQYDKLVVLGDPGTGKTTLARWLVLMFAKCILEGDKHVKIPATLVNAAEVPTDGDYDFGPVRFPILLRVGELAQRQKENPNITLAEFIGNHSWMGRYPHYHEAALTPNQPIPPDALNELMLGYIRNGEALFILDGLDEISEDKERIDMVQAIQEFIDLFIDLPNAKKLKRRNKLLITSRIAGYHTCPVQHEELYHVTIQAMEATAIEHFCSTWLKAAHLISDQNEKVFQLEFEAFELARRLTELIFMPNQTGARDLASNPLLLTELCKVFYSQDQKLPDTRVALYEKAAENFFEVGEARIRKQKSIISNFREKVFYILEDIAEYIHENYPVGLIITEEVEILTRHALHSFYKDAGQTQLPSVIEGEVMAFLKWLREDVGILAARAEELYGFLHLSFEEYFAARKLIRYPEKITNAIINRAYKPRWREPLLMAISTMNQRLLKKDRDRVLESLLNIQDPMGNLVPRSANLIALSFSEMSYTPDGDLIKEVVVRLLKAYERTELFQDGNILRSNVIETFHTLSEKGKKIYPKVLEVLTFIIKSPSFDQSMKNAVVDLLLQLKWRNITIMNGIIENRSLDAMAWGWPFHKTLNIVANENPDILRHHSLEFRAFLMENPEIVAHITKSQAWSRIIILLYGGLVEEDKTYKFAPEGIIRESCLTEEIIETLEAQEPPNSLRDYCLEVWNSKNIDDEERVDALMYLTALGEPLARELRALAKKPNSTIVKSIVERLSLCHQMLHLPVGIIGREMSGSLDAIVGNMNINNVQLFVNSVIQLTTSFDAKVSSPITWIKAMPEELQARTLAELWVHSFTSSDDTLYNLAVIFDTLGKEIRQLGTETIARSFTEVYNVATLPPQDKWQIEQLPYHPEAMEDVVEEALHSIDALKPEFDLFKFWALKEMKPLVDEHAGASVESLIKRMLRKMRSPRYLEASLRLYFPELLPDVEEKDERNKMLIRSTFLKWDEEIQAEGSPYLVLAPNKFYLVTSEVLKKEFGKRPDKYLRMIFGLLSSLRKYGSVHTAADSPMQTQISKAVQLCLTEADRAIALLESPNLQIKGWIKLASFYPEATRNMIITKALEKASAIPTGEDLALILRALKPWVVKSRPLSKKYIEQSQRLKKVLHQSILENRYYPQFLDLPDLPEKNVKLATLALGALVRDGNHIFTLPDNVEELWELVQQPSHPYLSEIVDKIFKRGRRKSFKLSLQGALALSGIIQDGHIEEVKKLMPVVSEPSREAISVVNNWLNHSDEQIKCFASLLLLETGILNAITFPYIEKIIFGNFDALQDQFRNRANIALNQSYFYASEMGLDCLYQIASVLTKQNKKYPYLTKALNWLFEYLYFDDVDILKALVKDAEGSGKKARLAHLLIRRIHFVSGREAYAVYLKGLYHENPKITKAFLYSSIFLLNRLYNVFRVEDLTEAIRKALIYNIRSKDPEIQNYALDALGYIYKLNEDDITLLKEVIESGGETQRYLAIVTLGRQVFFEEETYITALLKHKDDVVIDAASEAVCRAAVIYGKGDFPAILNNIKQQLGDPSRVLTGILNAARYLWWGSYTKNCIKLLGYYFEEYPKDFEKFVPQAIKRLTPLKRRAPHGIYTEDFAWMEQMVWLDGLAIGAEKLPATYMRQAKQFIDFEGTLQQLALRSTIFTDRMNAVKCLSLLRKMSPSCMEAFAAALQDITHVQEEAIFSAQRFQEIDKHFVQALGELMDHESLGSRYATIQILAAIGNYIKTESDTRQEILEVLLKKIDHPDYNKDVYLMKRANNSDINSELQYMGPLNHEIYRKVLEISGVKAKVIL